MDEAALHELLSGRRQGISAGLIRGGLQLGSWAYAGAVGLRNFGYDCRCFGIHRAAAPVISIGNITTGGTGKTPFAAWLANWLTAAGRKPGLLSRGYRSLNRQSSHVVRGSPDPALHVVRGSPDPVLIGARTSGNDEKLVLDRLCPGVPHLQQQDRVASAERAVREFGCDVLLLDDGFQHRRLHRDLDLVLVDSLEPWGYGHLLPRGLLRESLSGLRRADIIVLTRADQSTEEQRQALRSELLRRRNNPECVEVAFIPTQLLDLEWHPRLLNSIAGKRAFAFCGIGNPEGFRRTVISLNPSCVTLQAFPDHHHYTEQDLAGLANRADELGADVVLTTQKDLVKIAPDAWNGPPLFAVEIGVEFVSGLELLETRLSMIYALKSI